MRGATYDGQLWERQLGARLTLWELHGMRRLGKMRKQGNS
jgi:hypothetical protein